MRWLVLLLLAAPAYAAPPAGSDGSLAPWFQSLRSPATDILCCSEADCRQVENRIRGDHFQVFVDRKSFGDRAPNAWVDVPSTAIIHGRDNPTGEAIACFYGGEVKCFVQASGT